jgi:hypothetical protein
VNTEFYERGDSYEESLQRVKYLKHVIEDNDGYRVFYVNGEPVKRESDLHTMFRLTWYATVFDVNAEVNNGRGPVDYKVSKGRRNASLRIRSRPRREYRMSVTISHSAIRIIFVPAAPLGDADAFDHRCASHALQPQAVKPFSSIAARTASSSRTPWTS